MLLEGLLSLRRENIGTVALVAAGNSAVLDVALTAPNGRFELAWPALPPGSILYGFPGRVLQAGDIAEALADPSTLVYEAMVPLVPTARLIFVNAISTCVCAVLKRDFPFAAARPPATTLYA
jgi:hypothetical protein